MAVQEFEYEGKTALVTGGSSGIGLALAKLLAARGAQVWLLARRGDLLETARGEVGHGCRSLAADVSDWNAVRKAAEQIARETGTPDLVFNSAGVTHPGYVEELDVDIFRQMIEINYLGTVHVVKAVLPGMLERGSGWIVNICSAAGFLGVFGYTAYGASKYALRGFSDALRAEMKPRGIRVTIAFPPDTDTPQLAYEEPLKPAETRALSSSAGRLSAETVAEAILRGMRRGRYAIVPGSENQFLYRLSGLLGDGVYPVMDWMVADARRKVQRSS
jgi:3-dehydrosphinganine reductase